MTDIKRGRGRPKNSPNKNKMPRTQALMKASLQGLELGLKHFREILLADKSTEKQKEVAATRLMEIGYKFLTSVDPDVASHKFRESGVDVESDEEVEKEGKKETKPFSLLSFDNQKK